MAWRRGTGGKGGSRVPLNYGYYDHAGHLNRWDKLWVKRKERKIGKREAQDRN